MCGEEVTISSIERTVRDDNPEMKGVQAVGVTDSALQGNKVNRTGDTGSHAASGILKIMAVAVGIFLIVAGFLGLLGLISTLVVGQTFLSEWPMVWNNDLQISGFLHHFISNSGASWGFFSVGLLAGIPLLSMLYVGTKLVFNYKSNNAAIGLGMVGIWLIALVGLVVVMASEASNFRNTSSLSDSETIYPAPGKTLNLLLAEDKFEVFSDFSWDIARFRAVKLDDKSLLLGEPRLDIEKSATSDVVLVIKKRARGKSKGEANDNIREIIYNYQLTDSTITFDPWFMLGENDNGLCWEKTINGATSTLILSLKSPREHRCFSLKK